MITKDEYQKMHKLESSSYIKIIESALRNRKTHINIGNVSYDQWDTLAGELRDILVNSGWKVAFNRSTCRDDEGDIYVTLT